MKCAFETIRRFDGSEQGISGAGLLTNVVAKIGDIQQFFKEADDEIEHGIAPWIDGLVFRQQRLPIPRTRGMSRDCQ